MSHRRTTSTAGTLDDWDPEPKSGVQQRSAHLTAADVHDTTPRPRHGAQSGPAALAPTLADRQAALADAYPDEYVVLLGDRLIVHTHDKEDAYRHYDAVLEQTPGQVPIVIPPGERRRIAPPVVRGRALAGLPKARRR